MNEATTANAFIIAATDGDPRFSIKRASPRLAFSRGQNLRQGNPLDRARIIANSGSSCGAPAGAYLVFTRARTGGSITIKEFEERLADSATLVEQTPEVTIYKLGPAPR